MHYQVAPHLGGVEYAVELKRSSLARSYGYGRVMNRARVSGLLSHSHIVCIGRFHGERVVFICWVVKMNHQSVTFVDHDIVGRVDVIGGQRTRS